jgi:hypothetical protein
MNEERSVCKKASDRNTALQKLYVSNGKNKGEERACITLGFMLFGTK